MPDFPILRNTDRFILSPATPDSVGAILSGMGFGSALGTYPSANAAFYMPVSVHGKITVVKMFIENGATASGTVDVGIYDAGGARLVSSGSTAQTGTAAIQEFDITDTTLSPGLYYLAIAMDNTTGTLLRWSTSSALTKCMGIVGQASAFPLPSSATFAAVPSSNFPSVFASLRTVI
jgi:hypothetical protein